MDKTLVATKFVPVQLMTMGNVTLRPHHHGGPLTTTFSSPRPEQFMTMGNVSLWAALPLRSRHLGGPLTTTCCLVMLLSGVVARELDLEVILEAVLLLLLETCLRWRVLNMGSELMSGAR